jgi:DNA-binding response OmpR family regulator
MKTILVVDDEADIRRFLELILTEAGHAPVPVASGAEALVRAQREPPDLILLDVMMPEMDGWEVLAALKSQPETTDVPVVMISARTEGHGESVWRSRGAHDFIAKPFRLRSLLQRLEEILAEVAERRPVEA